MHTVCVCGSIYFCITFAFFVCLRFTFNFSLLASVLRSCFCFFSVSVFVLCTLIESHATTVVQHVPRTVLCCYCACICARVYVHDLIVLVFMHMLNTSDVHYICMYVSPGLYFVMDI